VTLDQAAMAWTIFAIFATIIFAAALLFAWRVRHPLSPKVTDEMRASGLKWHRLPDGRWAEVCDFCGGNCGQCGLTSRIGCEVPASMSEMAKNLYKGSR
jgi:hypothetical protein